ncbi:MAG: hypothetical protein JST83_06705 [Bacteroidetes bacterium]|nr:hypothetical protein [Bacteroidota bacterium]
MKSAFFLIAVIASAGPDLRPHGQPPSGRIRTAAKDEVTPASLQKKSHIRTAAMISAAVLTVGTIAAGVIYQDKKKTPYLHRWLP